MGILERNDNMINYTLLNEQPLFKFTSNKEINVLIIGNTELSFDFLKCMYHCCQMSNMHINVAFLTNNKAFKSDFFGISPELKRFNYVTVKFDERLNDFQEVIDEYKTCTYVYIDTEDLSCMYRTVDNKDIADACQAIFEYENGNDKVCINYVSSDYYSSGPYIVNENKKYSRSILNKISKKIDTGMKSELEQRAFNIHYAYAKHGNQRINPKIEYQNFLKDDYSYDSSMAAAVNLIYKLKSIGVDIDASKDVIMKKIQKNRDKLIALEHKRWNAFMIVNGWSCPTIETYQKYAFLNGNTHKNNACKLHPCIAESAVYYDADKIQPIHSRSKKVIDSYTLDGIEQMKLDDLDKQSLRIHLLAKERTEELNKFFLNIVADERNVELDNLFAALDNSFKNFDIESFYLFKNTLMNINDRKDWEVELLSKLPVVKEYIEFKDYKEFDGEIIDLIPYLLYKKDSSKLIKMKGNKLERDITSTLLIEPDEVYFCKYTSEEQRLITQFFAERYDGDSPINIHFTNEAETFADVETLIDITDTSPIEVYKVCKTEDAEVICLQNGKIYDVKNDSVYITPIRNISFNVKEKLLLNGIDIISNTQRSYTELSAMWRVFSEFSRPSGGVKNGNFAKAVNYLNGTCEYTKLKRQGKQFIVEEKKYNSDYYKNEQIERLKNLFLNNKLITNIKPKPHNALEAFECKNDNIAYYLEKGGNFLEQYIASHAESCNFFDDIRTNTVFRWGKENQSLCNEIDVVLVKGFETAFVSCKNTEKLNQLYIHQIRSIADKVGAIPFLVYVGQETEENNTMLALAEIMGVNVITYKDILPGSIDTLLKNIFSPDVKSILKR